MALHWINDNYFGHIFLPKIIRQKVLHCLAKINYFAFRSTFLPVTNEQTNKFDHKKSAQSNNPTTIYNPIYTKWPMDIVTDKFLRKFSWCWCSLSSWVSLLFQSICSMRSIGNIWVSKQHYTLISARICPTACQQNWPRVDKVIATVLYLSPDRRDERTREEGEAEGRGGGPLYR